MEKLKKITATFKKYSLSHLFHDSRIHPLLSFEFPGCRFFVKREDEIGGLGGGSKVRKYLSLLPFLIKENYEEVLVMGSPFSNHVLSFSQLLIQNRIKPILLLYKTHSKKQGNFLWTSLLVPKEDIHWIEKQSEIEKYLNLSSKKTAFIAEGGYMKESIPGALSLALDILRNEKELGESFDHVIIDSGTGLIAAVLLLTFSYLKKNTALHIVQMAGGEEEFKNRLQEVKRDFEKLLDISDLPLSAFTVSSPQKGQSLGSSHPSLFKNIVEIARKEGLFTDPVFSGKLFAEVKEITKERKLSGNVLVIHSGGFSALSGYQDSFAELI